jgi:hypothetical protein
VLFPNVEFDHADVVAYWIGAYDDAPGEPDAGVAAAVDLVRTLHRLGDDQMAVLIILVMGVQCHADHVAYLMALATLVAHPMNSTFLAMYMRDRAGKVAEGN